MRGATPGSDRIVRVLLDGDSSPVWLQAWGGANTIAQALKTIEERHPDRKADVSVKAKPFLITCQDQTYQDDVSRNWPDVETLVSTAFGAIAYRWRDIMPRELRSYFDGSWMSQHILRDHGPLCAVYAYLWEDNHSETVSMVLNNQIVVRRHHTGVEGEWQRLGPWFVTVTDRSIEITTSGGAANISGVEVWRKK